MSKLPPTRFDILADRLVEQAAPRLVERVAELVAERYGEVPPLLDADGAAHYLGIDAKTIRRMAARGEIPVAARIGDGSRPRLRFDADELREHLSSPAKCDTTGSHGIGCPEAGDSVEGEVMVGKHSTDREESSRGNQL